MEWGGGWPVLCSAPGSITPVWIAFLKPRLSLWKYRNKLNRPSQLLYLFVPLLHYYCTTIVILLYYYFTITVLPLYYYCTSVLLLYCCCTTAALLLYYCTTVLPLNYYCTITCTILLYYTPLHRARPQTWSIVEGSVGWREKSSKWRVFSLGNNLGVTVAWLRAIGRPQTSLDSSKYP